MLMINGETKAPSPPYLAINKKVPEDGIYLVGSCYAIRLATGHAGLSDSTIFKWEPVKGQVTLENE